MISPQNLLIHELIGSEVTVMKSNNKQVIGFSGKIIDETKSMIFLNTKNGIKKIPKENVEWKFLFDDNNSTVIVSVPEKRSHERFGGKI